MHATVGAALPAGEAVAAIDVRFDRAAVAGLEAVRLGPCVDDLDAQLMAQDPGIAEERLAPGEGMEVGPAHPDPVHPHEGFARPGLWGGSILGDKFPWGLENDALHGFGVGICPSSNE